MRVIKKTLYEVVCINREEEMNKRELKTQINYIKVFLNSGSEIKLENEKN